MRRRFASSPVGRLATVRADGAPHIVPVVFAVDGDTIFTAVDAKPKRTSRLQRLINLESDSRCAILVDHYAEDWTTLWWVRADGTAAVADPTESAHGIATLVRRHEQYRVDEPPGPVLAVRVHRWSGWSAIP